MGNVGQVLLNSFNNGVFGIFNFIPRFVTGLIILLLGIIASSLIKRALIGLFSNVQLESYIRKYGVPEMKEEFSWANMIVEIVRWFILILFLIPTSDIWGLPKISEVLNEFLRYIPNVLVAAIIAVVGFVFGRLAYDLVFASTKGLAKESAKTVANVTRWAINIFVILAVLNQLGVATDLIRILFTGFVAMIALAGGIAFGLGGQDTAKDILGYLRKKLK